MESKRERGVQMRRKIKVCVCMKAGKRELQRECVSIFTAGQGLYANTDMLCVLVHVCSYMDSCDLLVRISYVCAHLYGMCMYVCPHYLQTRMSREALSGLLCYSI